MVRSSAHAHDRCNRYCTYNVQNMREDFDATSLLLPIICCIPLVIHSLQGLSQSKMIQRWSSQSQTRLPPQLCSHAEQHQMITKGLHPFPHTGPWSVMEPFPPIATDMELLYNEEAAAFSLERTMIDGDEGTSPPPPLPLPLASEDVYFLFLPKYIYFSH